MVHTQEPAPAASDTGVNQAPSRAQQLMGDFAPKLAELTDYIERGENGMQSFDQHLLELFNQDKISGREALAWASKPETFAMAMRGIRTVGSGRKE